MANQVKSKQRVADHGEVFTAEREVNEMLNLVKQETERVESRFLEPACGDGNFLAEILRHKLEAAKRAAIPPKKKKPLPSEYEKQAVIAISGLYGIDLLKDNVQSCRERLFNIWFGEYQSVCKKDINEECIETVKFILERNILCGNALTMMCVDEEGQNTDEYIVFSEWSFSEGNKMQRKDYRFDKMLSGECEPLGAPNQRSFFSVIIGNPPYQLNDGGNGASAKPIYHLFVEQAKKLNPRFLTMIIPARWYAGGKGLDSFRAEMLNDRRLTQLHDFVDASDCFADVEIKGGVCYFLWENDKNDDCEVFTHKGDNIVSRMKRPLLESGSDTFIRYNEAIKILRKVRSQNEETLAGLVSARKPFGFATNFKDYNKKKSKVKNLYLYARKDRGYVSKSQITKNPDWIDKWKVYIPEAIGAGNMEKDVVKPIVDGPGTVCSETYVVVGPYDDENTARNVESYVKTKFFHFMLGLKKITQHTTAKTYFYVPIQDFSKAWDDDALYQKYGLTEDEKRFIEESVWPGKSAKQVYKVSRND